MSRPKEQKQGTDPNKVNLSRRQFLKDAAITSAAIATAGVLGSAPAQAQTQCPPTGIPDKWDQETDVIVVGFGFAGGAAAIEARAQGADVVLVERLSSVVGSASYWSAANYSCVDSSAQKAAGIAGDPKKLLATKLEEADNIGRPPDSARMEAYCMNAGKDVADWMQDVVMGKDNVTTSATGGVAKPGNEPSAGAATVKAMETLLKAKGAKIQYSTKLVRIVSTLPKKEVLGVIVDQGGNQIAIKAKRAVVLATGGFPGNKDMVKKYSTVGSYGVLCSSAPKQDFTNLDGSGINQALDLGAGTACMHLVSGGPAIFKTRVQGRGYGSNCPGIDVNARGIRFHSEGDDFVSQDEDIFAQKGHTAWTVTDSTIVGAQARKGKAIASSFSDDLSVEIAAGTVLAADSIEKLAAAMKVDPAMLANTVTNWNAMCGIKTDLDYGRTSPVLTPIKGPTFYAVQIAAGFYTTEGGLVTDINGRVIDVAGNVIPRFYAAGEAVDFAYISACGECLYWGRVTGKNAAAEKPPAA